MAQTDPADEAYFLQAIDWLALLFEAGDRRAIGEVAYKLIPQAFFRILWNLIIAKPALRKIVRAISRHNVEALDGDVSDLRDGQSSVFANVRRAIEVGLHANPLLRFDMASLREHNRVREADVRGRTLALTHPAYHLFLAVDRQPALAMSLVVQQDAETAQPRA
jgi:hypothetical protein